MERSGVSEDRGRRIIGLTADNYYWCLECASTIHVPDTVQLWAPNSQREQWALGWRLMDDNGEVVDSDHLRADSFAEFPAMVPKQVARYVGAALNAASTWDPSERCDHTRATSASRLDDDRYLCGYCGQPFAGPFPVRAR